MSDYQTETIGGATVVVISRPAPLAPPVISMRQARLALLAAGKLAAVDAAINSMPEPDKSRARIEWDYASELNRGWPLVATLGAAVGLSEAQIDALFAAAAGL